MINQSDETRNRPTKRQHQSDFFNRPVDLPALVAITHLAVNVRSAACLNSCRYSKCQTAVETELLGTAEPALQARSTSDVTETYVRR